MDNSSSDPGSQGRRYPVPVVDGLLGKSTFYEEQRGDFVDACKAAWAECVETRRYSDTSRLVSALTALGIVQKLQGDINLAKNSLEEAVQLSQEEPKQQYLALIHLLDLARLSHDYFPDGGCSYARDTQVHYSSTDDLETWILAVGKAEALFDDTALALEGKMLRSRRMVMRPSRIGPDREGNTSIGYLKSCATAFQQECVVIEQRRASVGNVAALQLNLSDAQFRAGDYEAASMSVRKAHQTYKILEDHIGDANCDVKLGDWIVAPLSCPEIWNVFLGEGSYDHALHWKIEAAESDLSKLDIAAARRYYDNAFGRYGEGQSIRGQAFLKMRLGYLEVLSADSSPQPEVHYSEARDHIAHAANMYESSGDFRGQYLSQAQIALCRVGMGDFPEDVALASNIGHWGRGSGSFSFVLGIGLFFTRIGRRWLNRSGDYQRALACFRLGAACLSALQAPLAHIHSVGDQLTVYEMLGDTSALVRTTEHAFDLCSTMVQKSPSRKAQASTVAIWYITRLLVFANKKALPDTIARARDRTDAAHDPANLFEGLRESNQGPQDLSALIRSIMAVKNNTSNPDTNTFPSYNRDERAIIISGRNSLRQSLFYEMLYRGKKARQSGRRGEAQNHFAEAGRLAESLDVFRPSFMNAMVEAYQQHDQLAVQFFRKYLDEESNFSRNFDPVPSLQVDHRRQIGSQGLAFFCEMGAFEDGRRCLDLLVRQSGANWWQLDGSAWDNLLRVAQVEEGTGELTKAFSIYTVAMGLFEDRRQRLSADEMKVAFASDSTMQSTYFNAARVALRLRAEASDQSATHRFSSEAFNAIERGKARSLLDLMAGSNMDKGEQRMSQAAVRRWRTLGAFLSTRGSLLERELAEKQPNDAKITDLKREIAETETKLQEAEAQVGKGSASILSLTPKIVQLDKLVASLKADTAILQYVFTPFELISWAITSEGMVNPSRRSTEYYQLSQQLKLVHDSCKWGQSAPEAAQWLAKTLLHPFSDTINSCSKLIIIPHGALHSLPFQVLPWDDQPLGATHAISYLPSASTITYLKSSESFSISDGVLAIGNPANMSMGTQASDEEVRYFDSLPGAEIEANTIAQWVPLSISLTGNHATRLNVLSKIQKHSILHFATHCKPRVDIPLLSSIMLANGEALTVYEMIDWDVKASLIVLSACQTGRGEATAGDDVIGLSRALLAAGARAVLVSLWPVDDLATSLLLINFYQRLMNGEPPAEALQGAQNYLRLSLGHNHEVAGVLRDFPAELKGLNVAENVAKAAAESLRDNFEHGPTENTSRARDVEPDSPSSPAEAGYSHAKYWAPFILIGT